MAKVSSRTRISASVKQVPQTTEDKASQPGTVPAGQQGKPSVNSSEYDPHADATTSEKIPRFASDTSGAGKASKPVDRQYVLGMTEDEGLQLYQARCMIQLLEDMALCGGQVISDTTIGSFSAIFRS